MRRRPLVEKAYADHWSEEPRSAQYQAFLMKCRNSFSQDKNTYNPIERFESLLGDPTLITTYHQCLKEGYKAQWNWLQNEFESSLRRKENRHRPWAVVDLWNEEIQYIQLFHDATIYTEWWNLFKTEAEKAREEDQLAAYAAQHLFFLQNPRCLPQLDKSEIRAKKQKKWTRWIRDWREHQATNLPLYAHMTLQEWCESEGIPVNEFIAADRYVRKLETDR